MLELFGFLLGYHASALYWSIRDKLTGILEWIVRPIEEGMQR